MDVRPWPEAALNADLSGILLLPGDSKREGYELSLTLNKIVQEELNTPFTPTPGISPAAKSGSSVMEFHVYYHGSKPETVIVVRLFGGALDRPSGVTIIKSFLASLNAAAVGKESATTMDGQMHMSASGEIILPPIEDLMPKQYLSRSLFKAMTMVGKALTCSMLPFQEGFPNKTGNNFRTHVWSFSLGKEGEVLVTTRLLPLQLDYDHRGQVEPRK